MSPHRWPDTTGTPPPQDHPYEAALWLLGRHPQLAALVERIPGAVDPDGLDLGAVADTVRALDELRTALEAYRAASYEPSDDPAWHQWRAAGPQPSPAVNALLAMSRTEQNRVRLLATLEGGGCRFSIGNLSGFDAAGQDLIRDWCTLVQGEGS